MDPFYYYAQYRVLICKSCQYAIQPNHIAAHLQSEQHKVSRQQSKEIAEKYKDYNLANPHIESVAPEGLIEPIGHLPIHRDGLACSTCSYVCRSLKVIKRHQREVHNIRIGRGRRPESVGWSTNVWCQCFFISVGQRYFKVQQTNQQLIQQATDTTTRLLQLVYRQLDQKEKAIEEKRQIIKDSDDLTEVSSWLDRTQWIRHLEGQDKATIVKLVNPARDEEMELQHVEKSLKRLVEKARQTILQKKINTFTLHRIQNFHAGEDSHKPFHVNLGADTIERYQRVWSKLLIYVLRTAESETRLYRLTEDQ
ncbi:hypothetical protein GP486_006461 [Trichoglossum hirsutum]|uniref:C2H2-type domain-containing protein n=1 Tax=Trichoglossum hirsutum TaxID=265104 RepID=A0A9P8IH89_9PEZI|nr:hypothetical protein GP486_006461 [Trichoglossum hirsutum]